MNHTEYEEESQVEGEAVGAELEESAEHPIESADVESETENEDSSPGLSAEELKRRHEEKKAKAIARKQRKKAEKASQENDLLRQRLEELEARQEVASMTVSKRPDSLDYDTDEDYHEALDAHYAEKFAKQNAQKKYAKKEPAQEQHAQNTPIMDEDAYELAAELEEERMDVDPNFDDVKADFSDLLEDKLNRKFGHGNVDAGAVEHILQRAFLEEGEGEFDWCDAIEGLSKSKAGMSKIIKADADLKKTAHILKQYAEKVKPKKKTKAKTKQVQSRPEIKLTGSSSPSVSNTDEVGVLYSKYIELQKEYQKTRDPQTQAKARKVQRLWHSKAYQ